ncbi:hypothetical protein C8R45DRAFT_926980 [Mycena sanguinolenta]|nr:hypothetical protein C8R45DRAFT_926980 [Mycena sanguinolenta]
MQPRSAIWDYVDYCRSTRVRAMRCHWFSFFFLKYSRNSGTLTEQLCTKEKARERVDLLTRHPSKDLPPNIVSSVRRAASNPDGGAFRRQLSSTRKALQRAFQQRRVAVTRMITGEASHRGGGGHKSRSTESRAEKSSIGRAPTRSIHTKLSHPIPPYHDDSPVHCRTKPPNLRSRKHQILFGGVERLLKWKLVGVGYKSRGAVIRRDGEMRGEGGEPARRRGAGEMEGSGMGKSETRGAGSRPAEPGVEEGRIFQKSRRGQYRDGEELPVGKASQQKEREGSDAIMPLSTVDLALLPSCTSDSCSVPCSGALDTRQQSWRGAPFFAVYLAAARRDAVYLAGLVAAAEVSRRTSSSWTWQWRRQAAQSYGPGADRSASGHERQHTDRNREARRRGKVQEKIRRRPKKGAKKGKCKGSEERRSGRKDELKEKRRTHITGTYKS